MFSFAEITTRCKEYNNWPQTANIIHHKKLPLNEKAPCQTSSSSISITPLVCLFPPPLPHTALSPSEGCYDSLSTLSPSPPPAASSAESALLYRNHFYIPFLSPGASHPTERLLCSILNRLNEDMLS